MIEAFLGFEFILLLLLMLLWGAAAFAVNHLKYVQSNSAFVTRWRKAARASSLIGLALLSLWILDLTLVWIHFGWLFVMDRFAVVMPLLLVPAAAVLFVALPELASTSGKHSLRAAIVPIHAMLAGTLLAFYLVTMHIPAIPESEDILLHGGILALTAAALWIYHSARLNRLKQRQPALLARVVRGLLMCSLAIIITFTGFTLSMKNSELPGTMAMVHQASADFGGGAPFALGAMHGSMDHGSSSHGGSPTTLDERISVDDLKGPQDQKPDRRYELIAEKQTVKLASGQSIEAWTFNGQAPGPQLVADEGDLVEVVLRNNNIEDGVTLHWHGIDVRNAEDGVAGMTQNAVLPGESHTYRFVVNESGTHWYHSHQQSSLQVREGLFGSLVIRPADEKIDTEMVDATLIAHSWMKPDGTIIPALNSNDGFQSKKTAPGTLMRLRLVNADNAIRTFSLNGASYRVTAIDGYRLNRPGSLTDSLLNIGGGGRYDIEFIMPETPVTLALHIDGNPIGYVYSADGKAAAESLEHGEPLDIYSYGEPAQASFDATTKFDRSFTLILDQTYFGFYNGQGGSQWIINGETFPDTPTLMVREGDLVKTSFVNRSFADHPFHLHGHHVQLLSKNGRPVSGSPLILDTVTVMPGETIEVAFLANNPGLWMDHCHNLEHAMLGMTMHVAYKHVYSPYAIGDDTGNHPE
ncbi:multicopper oxidase family protein [Paenibacillus sp. HB172176]|uniref:multicopper oxidase family protein n=1 Tax=Paenibacillus sp. HB172176 TaxID=2493690 RepID=UPI00143BE933|nr:multicopper oxidase family protein [Paenibacillus sp. HB172176]